MTWFWKLDNQLRTELIIATMSFVCAVSGWYTRNFLVVAVAGTCVLLLVGRWGKRLPQRLRNLRHLRRLASSVGQSTFDETDHETRTLQKPRSAAALVDHFLENGRWALLLRTELAAKLNKRQKQAAHEALVANMAEITAGKVWLSTPTKDETEMGAATGLSAEVHELFLDRFAVSNEDYQSFLDDGGYQNDEFWCETSSPIRGEFVDLTGQPGPRYWTNGRYPKGEGRLPVVGVSWFEARAYARWAGKRLPVGPEWVKAASAPVASATTPGQQRIYPWGESVSSTQANLWQAGLGRCAPVTDYAQQAQHGICQLVGNVWEWIDDDFITWSGRSGWEAKTGSLKSIRGGAFDTYLESQATNLSQSGEDPFARRHNIGFRCAIDKQRVELAPC